MVCMCSAIVELDKCVFPYVVKCADCLIDSQCLRVEWGLNDIPPSVRLRESDSDQTASSCSSVSVT